MCKHFQHVQQELQYSLYGQGSASDQLEEHSERVYSFISGNLEQHIEYM
jgi:hypothetical protein